MGEDTSNPLEVADTKRVEGGGHGMDEGAVVLELALALVQEQGQVRGGVGDELAGVVVVVGNVQAEVGSDHIH